jgi:tetratricopeptide (TPR) repeat protein
MLGRRDARALVARLGGATADDVNSRTTIVVVGAEGFGPTPHGFNSGPGDSLVEAEGAGAGRNKSHKLMRAEELNAKHGASIRILTEDEFCHLAGLPTPEALKRQYHAMRDLLARYRALREDHLRYLVKCGVIQPVLRTNADIYFAFPALPPIRQANDELAGGRSFRSVVRALMASNQGQLALDFRLDARPARIVTLQRPAANRPAVSSSDAALAERYFRAGSALDDGSEPGRERTATAYRKALEFDPYLVPALINLANIHYCQDEPTEAQVLYERAIALEPDYFEAHFNLGNIHHDLGRLSEALGCYREALHLNPGYPEGHFYLAVTLEKMGLSGEARPHWRAYQKLAPRGEWVELAREFSE